MEEIEISNRLYREAGADYMTVVLPGLSESKTPTSGPVCFILSADRLITLRYHVPRPFETYPERADKVGPGCDRPDYIFLGLIEEIIGRMADILENIGRGLDEVAAGVYQGTPHGLRAEVLQSALERVGREGDLLGRLRLGLLTVERAVSFYGQTPAKQPGDPQRPHIKALMRDLQALEVHADFLGSRLALTSDATLGMINLAQNVTVRIVSVVAALFLPPTLIASAYGMNFAHMPELAQPWGYPMALFFMLASAVGTYLFFKWKRWL
jgi:magnesium transporter